MNKNNISCAIVQDLLPNYIDELTSKETNESLQLHLQNCPKCRESYERMKGGLSVEKEESLESETEVIDFLKKEKRKNAQKVWMGIIGSILVVLLVIACIIFKMQRPVDNSQMVNCAVYVDGKEISVNGHLEDSLMGVSDLFFEENEGIITIHIKESLKNKKCQNDFSTKYTARGDIQSVYIGKDVIWMNGGKIDQNVMKVYKTRHAYVGDVSKNAQTLGALGINELFGPYTIELQTEHEPYGMTIAFKQDFSSETEANEKLGDMETYAGLMMALIDNLEEVNIKYYVNKLEYISTIPVESADYNIGRGQSVKVAGKSLAGLQYLMDLADVNDNGSIPIEAYSINEDGSWNCNGRTYAFYKVLQGSVSEEDSKLSNGLDSGKRYVVLTNKANITYEEVFEKYYKSDENLLDKEDTIVVGIEQK